MAIELPKDSFETVSEEQKESIKRKMEEAEKDLHLLISDIRNKAYDRAVNCLERAKHAMFGYIRRWLALGLICPRASSFIERTMRAIGLAGGRWIVLSPEGFGEGWRPNPKFEKFCAEGRLLFISL